MDTLSLCHTGVARPKISVVQSNVRSLRNKFDELLLLVERVHPDIIALTETWLSPDILDSEFHLAGYYMYRADRSPQRIGGGVALYCKEHLHPSLLEEYKDPEGTEESLWCRLRLLNSNVTVGVVYRSPISIGLQSLVRLKRYCSHGNTLVLGDFNAPSIDWNSYCCEAPTDSFDTKLLESVLDVNLIQHVQTPTRLQLNQEHNILDLVLSPYEDDVADLQILEPLGKSDHATVHFQWLRGSAVFSRKSVRRNVWRTDIPGIVSEAKSMLWDFHTNANVDEMWRQFKAQLMYLCEKYIPQSRPRKIAQGPPWIDAELRRLLKLRRRRWDVFKRTKAEEDYTSYKECRNKCTSLKRTKRVAFEALLAAESKKAPKKLFSYIRRRTKKNFGIPPLEDISGSLEDSDSGKADILLNQYSTVYSVEDGHLPHFVSRDNQFPPLESISFDLEEIKCLLNNLDTNAAPGPDELHPHTLKALCDCIAQPLMQIFRRSLEEGRLPSEWKSAVIKPMFKGGKDSHPGNYRPVSLTSVIGKVMERIVKARIEHYFENLGVLVPQQHGFQKRRSCTSNLLVAREKWSEALDCGANLDVVYVDFSKAFDKVPHQRLLLKLRSYGIQGILLDWIRDFLIGRTVNVSVNGAMSRSVEPTSGVPQGSVLGPTLFKIFVNDLPNEVGLECLLYADDLKLWISATSDATVEVLQSALDALHLWSTQWLLPINHEKCCVLPVGSTQPRGVYHIGGYLIREATLEKDLGILVAPDMKSSGDTVRRVGSATKMMWAIRRSFSKFSPYVFRLLFSSHVRPILEYGLPASYPLTIGERDRLEKVQRRGSKAVVGLRHLSYEGRLHQLGMFSLEYRRLRGDLIYTRRILNGELGNELLQFFRPAQSDLTRGHSKKLYKIRRERISIVSSLSTRVVNLWNSLPEHAVTAQTEEEFKRICDGLLAAGTGVRCLQCNPDGTRGCCRV
jgi:hypothetical protein